jgi:hypothetical protein
VGQKVNKEAAMVTEVVPMSAGEARLAEQERWLPRQTMQIFVQLPEEGPRPCRCWICASSLVWPL